LEWVQSVGWSVGVNACAVSFEIIIQLTLHTESASHELK